MKTKHPLLLRFVTFVLLVAMPSPGRTANPDTTPPGKSTSTPTPDNQSAPTSPNPSANSDCANGKAAGDRSASGGGSGSSGGDPCPESDPNSCDPSDPGCIIENITLAFAPNEPGLGAGLLRYYVNESGANLGDPKTLGFYGIPYMLATATDKGDVTSYSLLQAGGSALIFDVPEDFPAGQTTGYIEGLPMADSAFTQARATYVKTDGSPATKATANYLRQYRAGDGWVDYPVNGGRVSRFTTTTGRSYTFPLSGVEVIRERDDGKLVVNGSSTDGRLRQIKTRAGLLDIVVLGDRSFEVRKYAAEQVGAKGANDLYPPGVVATMTMKVEAPAATQDRVTIVKSQGTERHTTLHTVRTDTDPEKGTYELWTQTNVNGPFHYTRTLKNIQLLQRGAGYGESNRSAKVTSALGVAYPGPDPDIHLKSVTFLHFPRETTVTYKGGTVESALRTYSSVPWDAGGVGGVGSQRTLSGSGIQYSFDENTRRMQARSWTIVVPAGGGSAPVTKGETFDYAPLVPGESFLPFDFRPRTTTMREGGVEVGRKYHSYQVQGGEYVEIEETAATLAAAFGGPQNRRTEKRYFGTSVNKGRLREERHDDATLTQYTYTAQTDGGVLVTITRTLSPAGTAVSGYSTRTKELRTVRGWPVTVTNAHWVNGAWVEYEAISQTFDYSGQLTSRTRLDLLSNQSRILLEQKWDGARMTRSVDAAGVATRYEYVPETNILEKVRREAVPTAGGLAAQPEILTTYSGTFTMDESQDLAWEQQVRTTTAGEITLTESTTFDQKGRVVSTTDANGYTTGTAYSPDGRETTVTLPSGGTVITTQTSEGRVLRVTGTAVVPEFHHYQPVATRGMAHTIFAAVDNGPRWVSTETDAAGRTARVVRPSFAGQSNSETVYYYELGGPFGQPSMVTSTGRPATIYQYNAVNRLLRTGTSGDDELLALDSPTDRIQDSGMTMERIGNLLWQVSTSIVYPTAGSATAKTVSVQRALVAGFTGHQAALGESVDIAGNVARSTSTLERASRLSVRTSETPGASDHATTTALAGRTGIVHEPGSTGNVAITYDALGREESTQRPGITGAELTIYVPGKNLVHKTVDAAGHETTLAYVPQGLPGAGQVQTVTAADTGEVTTEYDLLGRVVGASGARQYPVAYTFDAYGQMETMTTWRDFATNAGAAVTTWVNDPATGLLASKRDDLQRATGYTYDTAGRLETRTWARLVAGQPLVTTYGYHPVTRDLESVTYSDGSTPAVWTTYDRLGRQESATTTATAQTVYMYRPDNLLPDTETVRLDVDGDGTMDFERVFQRNHDALLRPAGFTLKPALASVETDASAVYGYEPVAGRVETVSGLAGGQMRAFSYKWHLARPGLPDTVSGPAHTVKYHWEDSRDVLHQRRNLLGALIGDGSTNTEVSAFLYTVNKVHQRTAVAASGTAFAAGAGWTWGYDALGQVTSAAHSLDTARNRAFLFDDIGNRKESSTGLPPVLTTYTPNALNQSTAIAPPAPEAVIAPEYDFDGNQLSGHRSPVSGLLSFEWDGENRLKLVRDAGGKVQARYAYDYAGRRVRKTLLVPGTTTVAADTAYVSDGWNPVAEYTLATTPALLRRRNVWGLDLSGSVQGAGGVGGLLLTESTDAASLGVWFPTYDGNGNVSELLDPVGAIAAHYEYGPFGEPLGASGDDAELNPFRFSTKYHDAETGLYYYGHRYYDSGNGRWLSTDPIGEDGGLNLYGYVANNPVNGIDPLGLASVGDYVSGAWTGSKLTLTFKLLQKLGFEPNDSYFHCLTSCETAKKSGADVATDLGNLKESYSGQGDAQDTADDQAANAYGRSICPKNSKSKKDCHKECEAKYGKSVGKGYGPP